MLVGLDHFRKSNSDGLFHFFFVPVSAPSAGTSFRYEFCNFFSSGEIVFVPLLLRIVCSDENVLAMCDPVGSIVVNIHEIQLCASGLF